MLSSTLSFETFTSEYCLCCCFEGLSKLWPTLFYDYFYLLALVGSERSPWRSGLVLHFLVCSMWIYFCFWKPNRLSFIFSAESCCLALFIAKFFCPVATVPVPLWGDTPLELLGTSSKMTFYYDFFSGPTDTSFLFIKLMGFLYLSFSKWIRSCSVFILEFEEIEFGVEITSSCDTSSGN
jgi:hypothetical protein